MQSRPRPRVRSTARHNSTTAAGLYRIRTPLEHVDSIVVYEDDHGPHDSAAASTESLHEPTTRKTGFPLAAPLNEEEEGADHSVQRSNTEASSSDRTINVAPGAEKQLMRQRQAWCGERNDAQERERIRRVEREDKAGHAVGVLNEKNIEQGGVPDAKTRQWKDDIVSFAPSRHASRQAEIRSQVTFDTIDDPANPKNWPYLRKVMITLLYGTTTMCSTFASSVLSPASPYIQQEFGVGRQVAVLGISLFILGYVFGPLLWSSLSEQYGRKGTILVPVFIFMCLTAGTATAKDLQVRTGCQGRPSPSAC